MDDLENTLKTMSNAAANQVRNAIDIFLSRDLDRIPRLMEKDGYINQLNNLIDQRTFHELSRRRIEPFVARYYRGIYKISINLEKIGDYASNIAKQTQHLSAKIPAPLSKRFRTMAGKVQKGVKVGVEAFVLGDWELASDIAEVEQYLDAEYTKCFPESEELLHAGKITLPDMITNILAAKYLEKMGDSLENIAEAAISLAAGEYLKVQHLDNIKNISGKDGMSFRRADRGISGAFTGIVERPDGSRYFYKEGSFKVIQNEIAKSKEWNEIHKGIVPAVHRGVFDENSEGYLMDYLDGELFQDLYLNQESPHKVKATEKLLETLRVIWEKTLHEEECQLNSVQQIRERSKEIYSAHPELASYRSDTQCIGRVACRSLEEMLDLAETFQSRYTSPFTVFTHGDFNSDNIFFEADTGKVRFIDVHRSGPGDYAKDLGTFIVSNLRQPILKSNVGNDIYRANRMIYDFGKRFAENHEDIYFERRLELVLARNYITSARLFADHGHAKDLFFRGMYYLERFLG